MAGIDARQLHIRLSVSMRREEGCRTGARSVWVQETLMKGVDK